MLTNGILYTIYNRYQLYDLITHWEHYIKWMPTVYARRFNRN
jgi:hypothetical protein